eukprot:scaffold2553_cov162-Skeletonema_marinoi.AAC.11
MDWPYGGGAGVPYSSFIFSLLLKEGFSPSRPVSLSGDRGSPRMPPQGDGESPGNPPIEDPRGFPGKLTENDHNCPKECKKDPNKCKNLQDMCLLGVEGAALYPHLPPGKRVTGTGSFPGRGSPSPSPSSPDGGKP